MVSSPPVEVLVDTDDGHALVSLTAVGNGHVSAFPQHPPFTSYKLDEWALRQLVSQAESAADRLAEEDP